MRASVLVASLLALCAPAAAHAGSASLAGATLTYSAGAGEANRVTVTRSGANFVVTDTGVASITDGDGAGGCSVAANQATCPAAGVTRVTVRTADLVDAAAVASGIVTAATLDGGSGSDTLTSGAGNDSLLGRDGNDILSGRDGTDVLVGGTGADEYNGGGGSDLAAYSDSTVAEVVDIDNVADDGSADDGPAGARDNVKSDVENLRGGSGGDRLTGNLQANVIAGLGGNDLVFGRDGNDILFGSDGNDTLVGGTGADEYNGGGGSDMAAYSDSFQGEVVDIDGVADDGSPDDGPVGARDNVKTDVENLRGGQLGDALVGNAGNNRLEGLAGGDHLEGRAGNDVELGGDDRDLFFQGTAADGADLLSGQGGANDIAYYAFRTVALVVSIDDNPGDGETGEGDNVTSDTEDVSGGSGNDMLVGNAADNELSGYSGTDLIIAGSGADTLHGDYDTDELYGELGNDTLDGGYGADFEDGGDGDDTFVAVPCGSCGDGGDDVGGGNGTDTLDFGFRTVGLYVTLDDAVGDGEDADHDLDSEEDDNYHSDIENVVGTSDTDILRGSGANNEFTGGGAIDNLVTGAGNDILRGDDGNDYLDGGADNDQLLGGDGDDYLQQNAVTDGSDDLDGGPGLLDVVNYGSRTASRITVSKDNVANDGEFVVAPAEADNVRTSIEVVYGGDAGNNFFGSSGNERWHGGEGQDGGNLGGGNDEFWGYGEFDNINGGDGDDTLNGGEGQDNLQGGAGNDALNGENGNDILTGGADNDSENGGAGQDFFSQGNVASGADDLNCGTGFEGLGDRVQYTEGGAIFDGRTVGIYVSRDNVANDGENTDGDFSNGGEEGDNIHSDCENVWGGKAGDYFWGNAGNDTFVGMQGNDTLVGNDGNDYLDGRQGDDLLFAIDPSGPAADTLYGGTGEEVNGDAGQWDAGVDSVFEMEDTNPG